MMKPRFSASVVLVTLCLAAAAFGGRLSLQEHAAVQESLSRVHPRMRARWLKERGIEDPYYTSVRTDSGSGLQCIGRWSFGPSYDVDGRTTPSETLVALARGSGVSLLRFSRRDSLSIELLSDINAEGLMCRVKVVDALLYVGSRRGLEVYNIANEQNPVRLSWIPIPLNDFDVQDSLAYTISGGYTDSGGDDSFRIYNISNPASPVFRGACRDSGYLVSVAGNTAFLGDRWGLYVIDVTNPASPHRIGSWGSAIEQVEARGHLCYVTTFNPNQPGEITFHILDVAVPSLPYQIGSLDSAGGNDVFLIDTLAYGAGETDFNELTIISVADSTEPRLVGSDATRGWSYGIWASGLAQETFVGCHWEGLQIYDTRNASQPVRDTFLLGCDQSVDVYIDSGRAYVANEKSGLKILDVSNPTKPTTLGCYDTTWQRPFMTSVVARDSFAFVKWSRPKFRTLEVTDPTNPVYAGTCELFAYPEDMVLRDSLIYVAEMNRFQIVNVARPREPVLVGSCNSQSGVYFGLAVQDTLAYLISGVVQVIDVADPANPTVVSTNSSVGGHGIAVRDTFAYIPHPYDTFFVYSIADPLQLRRLSETPAGVWPWDVALAESVALVATVNGLDAFSLEDPAQPHWRGSISTAYALRRVVYAAPYFYTAMWEAGVSIYSAESLGLQEQVKPVPRPTALSAAPNPTLGRCLVSLGRAKASQVGLRDAAGRVVPSAVVRRETDQGLSLDLSKFAAGVYFVEVKTDGRISSVKVVKQ